MTNEDVGALCTEMVLISRRMGRRRRERSWKVERAPRENVKLGKSWEEGIEAGSHDLQSILPRARR